MIHRLVTTQVIPRPLETVWDFFSTPKNLNTLTPPGMGFEFIQGADQPMYLGQLIQYRIQILPIIKATWLTEITHLEPMSHFVDEQRLGPYQFWYHEHRFREVTDGTLATDTVTYSVPFAPLGGDIIHALAIRPKLQSIFSYRQLKINQLFNKG